MVFAPRLFARWHGQQPVMATHVTPARGIFSTKPAEALVRDAEERGASLKRVVGLLDLSALGVGALIGTGIFVIIGEAIGKSGPAIVLSFLLAGITCAFSALSYAELASTIPVSGSAYTYAYATLGELIAWIIGWDLILEYGVAVAAVAVGWGGYLNDLLDTVFGFTLPDAISQPPGEGGVVNLPAVFLVVAVASVLIAGVRESARTNTIMVVTKIGILVAFVVLAFTAFNADNITPFAPKGVSGVVSAASLIFFAYIGFDAISTSGEETRKPQRDLPIAIIGSLAVATILYVLVALAATGALPFAQLNGSEAPLADVLDKGAGLSWGATLISIGALIAITSVVLTILYGQTRIMFAMARDGLVPPRLAKLHDARRTPAFTTALFAFFIAILAAVVPLSEIAKLVNIGTLFAFLLVNVGVMVLRRTRPDLERGFRVPAVYVCAPIGAALCMYLMITLPLATWLRFVGWLVAGLAIYGLYGRRHSRVRRGEAGTAHREPVS
jgi:APA family basic amino acid/polyamine antiporter